MKTIISIISFILIFFTINEKLHAQGTDFWLSYGRNRDYNSNNVNLQVRIVASQDALVTFKYRQTGVTYSFPVLAGEVKTIPLSTSTPPHLKSNVYPNTTGVSDKSLHIESDVPISVYALNQFLNTTDATNVLSVDGLGTEYYQISYESCNYSYNDGFTAIATEDNTIISENGVAYPYPPLQKGQVLSRYFGQTDRTGMYITSNHPIAYFVTNGGVWIPRTLSNGADNIFQQLSPVNKWGMNFLVPVTHRGVERIRVLASQDNTVITQATGGVITTDDGYSTGSFNLNKGEFVELETTLSSCGCFISANKPVGVCTYLVGMEYYYNPALLITKGDPAMTWVPPIEQSINGALIAPFVPSGNTVLDEHYVLIVTPTATKNQTTVAIGTNAATGLTGGSWCDNSTSNYSFYSLPLYNESESYYIANPHGLVALGYGIGNYESYYYLSGAAARNLDAYFTVNDVHYEDLSLTGETICDTIINLKASVQYANSSVSGYLKWYIDGTEIVSKRDTLEWDTIFSIGAHSVKVIVQDMEGNDITMSAEFNVGVEYHKTVNAVICLGDTLTLGGFDTIPTQAGFINFSINDTTALGCDSITIVNLVVNPSYNIVIDTAVCYTGSYVDNDFDITLTNTETTSLTIRDTVYLKTAYGCDSIRIVNFTAYPKRQINFSVGICLGESYEEHGFDTIPTQAGIIYDTVYSQTIHGCDSLVTLTLLVYPVYHDTVITEICLGDTYDATAIGLNYITPADTGTFYYHKDYKTATYYCDSIKTLILTVNPVYDTTINATICLGERYQDEDNNFDTIPTHAGTVNYFVNIHTISGCDSIITLNLKVNPVYDELITAEICLGDRYRDDNFDTIPTQAGTVNYTRNPKTKNGCDSIFRLELTVHPSYHNLIKDTICLNEYYTANDFYVAPSQSGVFTYTHNLTTDKNCDSITVLELTVNPVYNISIRDTIYEDEYYKIGNYQYNTPGLHISNLQTIEGCDSVINLTLNVIYYPSEISAFSPFNKDGINDYFMAGFKIQVFNRYGQLVYETKTKEQQDFGWDGNNNKGNKVETGMYFYILYNSSGKPIIKSSVEVLKR
jgi:gliding motility-associated-like protein